MKTCQVSSAIENKKATNPIKGGGFFCSSSGGDDEQSDNVKAQGRGIVLRLILVFQSRLSRASLGGGFP